MAGLIVSISGIRGIVGDGLGPREATRFGLAFGTHLGGGRVVLGRDSRPSGPMLADALGEGLRATGCSIADVGILSTPGTSVMVRHLGARGGTVITASHNPAPYNGIKLLSPEGMALSRSDGRAVADLYHREAFTTVPADRMGTAESVTDAAEIHIERILGIVRAETVRAAALRIVVDAVNGAGGCEMQRLLEHLGCQSLLIHGDPTGRFARGPEPIPENLTDLSRAVRRHRAALGLALDPDADRLALVDETGRALGEEYTLALACRHRLTQEKGPLAANLSTSRLMDDVANEAGVPLYRTPVGELNVAETSRQKRCLLGGEGNGGVIDPRVALVRNSLVGAAFILEMMAARGKPLSELAAELPVYWMVKDKIPISRIRPETVFEAARKRFPDARADERDGLYLAWDRGWLHVRASNTEPVLRVLAEAKDKKTARTWVEEVQSLVRNQA